jgi:hypothetical protein
MRIRILSILLIFVGILTVSTAALFVVSRIVSVASITNYVTAHPRDTIPTPIIEPIYDDIWGTIYHAEVRQCDATPTITGDGSRINPYKASEHRWIAISQEMLDCEYRMQLLNDSTSALFRGRIEYGDTVWVASPYPEINGWWIVHDTKNKRYRKSIDFLQTKGDGSLYRNDPMWNGRFDGIRIYRADDVQKYGLKHPMT